MAKRKKIIEDKKLRGEWAEMQFMARAAEHGLSVSKPWGEMRPFDFVVGKTGRFVSIQVKSTVSECKTGYECTIRGGHRAYPENSFDFVAAYVVHADAWYILPAALIHGKTSVTLFPDSKTAKYEKYREAWDLLREATESDQKPESRVTDETEEGIAAEPVGAVAAGRLPANSFERMEAVASFFRKQMQGREGDPRKRNDGA